MFSVFKTSPRGLSTRAGLGPRGWPIGHLVTSNSGGKT